ncbi:MAG: hypothetical protein MI975_10580 [Cytophagales bacterium]|nr:hypothetical protein [Cytophagales bacterium]
MKGDLKIPKVTGVEVAVVKRENDDELWDVIIINRNSYPLNHVLITSKGYGSINGIKQQTTTFRYLIDHLGPNSYTKIEPIQNSVFHLTNEYWVSYYLHEEIYDKKYIFLPESIQQKYVAAIPGFDLKGVLHL